MSNSVTENDTSKTGTKYLVALWLESDTDPSDYDWKEVIPADATLEAVDAQEFIDVRHIAVVYITKQLNLEQWVELGEKQDAAIASVVGDDGAFVMAGPIPEVDVHEATLET